MSQKVAVLHYKVLKEGDGWGVVECTLTVYGVSSSDVGSDKEMRKHSNIPAKDAYSNAIKRMAVQFGIDRDL